jgi:predicted transcriptional regulator of viral defense system
VTVSSKTLQRAERAFRQAGGILRTRDALHHGIHRRALYALRDAGRIEQLARGAFLLAGHPVSERMDLVLVTARYPRAVVCLVSALEWHGLTTQIPRAVQIALPPGSRTPRLRYPPLRAFRFSGQAFSEGVERLEVDGFRVPVYGPAKTVADCFKFRSRVGLDIALEALRAGWRKRRFTMDELWRYARICRVDRVMRPYLESLG